MKSFALLILFFAQSYCAESTYFGDYHIKRSDIITAITSITVNLLRNKQNNTGTPIDKTEIFHKIVSQNEASKIEAWSKYSFTLNKDHTYILRMSTESRGEWMLLKNNIILNDPSGPIMVVFLPDNKLLINSMIPLILSKDE